VHPVCPVISPAGLHLLIVAGPKQQDLRRDGRYALHSETCPPPRQDDGFAVRGRAKEATDPGVGRVVRGQVLAERDGKVWPGFDEEIIFELGLDNCLLMLTQAEGAFPAGPTIWQAGNTRNAEGGTAPIWLPYGSAGPAEDPGAAGGRVSDTMSHAAADRYAWIEPDVEDLGGGVYRIPLPLPMEGLKAVNVYAITDPGGVDLIDAGIALVPARERLTAALRQIGYELGDVRNFFVTHIHIDHYSLAVELRRTFHTMISLGEGERANLIAIRELLKGNGSPVNFFGFDSLRRLGATELEASLAAANRNAPANIEWEDPDRWVADGTDLDLRTRTLQAVHTPGHTRGHLVFHDAAAQLMFAGDHVLPQITPSIGFEAAGHRMALRDYLSSLGRTLALPDARLLPAHGPVTASTHDRVKELLAHHDIRLAETFGAVQAGNATPYEVARAIQWTRRERLFSELDLFSQILAINETAAHLEVLTVRGELTCEVSAEGTDLYQVAAPQA
jgi:glyoxylase-like metal-dependent hydrolase (beta-lactamase superfamily II)